jgi:hypothetical protein
VRLPTMTFNKSKGRKKIMKVISAEKYEAEIVEVEDPGSTWTTYERSSSDNWQIRMGESWESHYDCEEVEAAYQEYKKQNRADDPLNISLESASSFLTVQRQAWKELQALKLKKAVEGFNKEVNNIMTKEQESEMSTPITSLDLQKQAWDQLSDIKSMISSIWTLIEQTTILIEEKEALIRRLEEELEGMRSTTREKREKRQED